LTSKTDIYKAKSPFSISHRLVELIDSTMADTTGSGTSISKFHLSILSDYNVSCVYTKLCGIGIRLSWKIWNHRSL